MLQNQVQHLQTLFRTCRTGKELIHEIEKFPHYADINKKSRMGMSSNYTWMWYGRMFFRVEKWSKTPCHATSVLLF